MPRDQTIGIRLSDEERAALDARASKEDRSRSDMGRLLILDGLGLRGQSPADAPVAASSTHPFKPRTGNALRCETCGKTKGQHK